MSSLDASMRGVHQLTPGDVFKISCSPSLNRGLFVYGVLLDIRHTSYLQIFCPALPVDVAPRGIVTFHLSSIPHLISKIEDCPA